MSSKQVYGIAILLFLIIPVMAFPYSGQQNADSILLEYKKQADENFESFKNGPAFDALVSYATLRFKLLTDSAKNQSAIITGRYSDSLVRQKDLYMKLVSEVQLLKQQNENLHAERNRLLRNAGVYVLIISLTGLLILYHKRRIARRESALAEETIHKLQFIEEYNLKAAKLQQATDDLRFSFSSISQLTSVMQERAETIRSLGVTLNMQLSAFDAMADHLSRINTSSATAVESIDHFMTFFNEQAQQKSLQNLNPLLDDMFHLALLWVQSEFPQLQCRLTKDLEKILPDMEFQPSTLRIAFFHLFCNAFQSVAEKALEAPKGFQPHVTVTSRKLPRFIQARIRDNGKGINLKDPYRVFEPFFTIHNKPYNAGLGLNKAFVILKEIYKAEIIIESNPDSGTDFIIRFPFNR